jgi:glutaredoxin
MTRLSSRRGFVRIAAASLLAALLAAPAAAQVYKWTGPDGKTHYGDTPPDDAKKQELKITAKSYDGPPQIQDWASILRRPTNVAGLQPRASSGLTMFSAVWCGPCKRAKAHLAQKAISYRDVDIEASDANAAEFASYGGGGVPLFIAGEKSMRGFSPQALENLMKK